MSPEYKAGPQDTVFEYFGVERDPRGDYSHIDPGSWSPTPEVVIAVSRDGTFSITTGGDDDYWSTYRVAGTIYNIAELLLSRIGNPE